MLVKNRGCKYWVSECEHTVNVFYLSIHSHTQWGGCGCLQAWNRLYRKCKYLHTAAFVISGSDWDLKGKKNILESKGKSWQCLMRAVNYCSPSSGWKGTGSNYVHGHQTNQRKDWKYLALKSGGFMDFTSMRAENPSQSHKRACMYKNHYGNCLSEGREASFLNILSIPQEVGFNIAEWTEY